MCWVFSSFSDFLTGCTTLYKALKLSEIEELRVLTTVNGNGIACHVVSDMMYVLYSAQCLHIVNKCWQK
jgi:hypothetical protein